MKGENSRIKGRLDNFLLSSPGSLLWLKVQVLECLGARFYGLSLSIWNTIPTKRIDVFIGIPPFGSAYLIRVFALAPGLLYLPDILHGNMWRERCQGGQLGKKTTFNIP